MIRQGDLLFIKAERIPEEATKVKDGVIALGEATGHAHRARQNTATVMTYLGVMYLKVLKEAYIDHEEHNTIILPRGIWEVKRQREYRPDGWRQVAD